MKTRYYVDAQGNYIGGFAGSFVLAADEETGKVTRVEHEPAPPAGAIEIPEPPKHGLDKLVAGKWVPYVPPPAPPTLEERVAALEAKLK